MFDLLLILLNKLINNTVLNNHIDNNRYNVLEKENAKQCKHQYAAAMIRKTKHIDNYKVKQTTEIGRVGKMKTCKNNSSNETQINCVM